MRFTYSAVMCDPAFYLTLAEVAEQSGFDTFAVHDSVIYPKDARDGQYPYNGDGSREFLDGVPQPDPFQLIAWMAARTSTITFLTSVAKVPIRQPVLLAKQVTSLAALTGNRLEFGVGLSPWREDFEAMGVPWEGRGRRLDEYIEVIRGLETGGYFGFEGETVRFAPLKLCPVPTEPIPILVGGHTPPAIRRAARADGWIGAGMGAEELNATIAALASERERAGRSSAPFAIHATTADSFSPAGIRRLEDIGVHQTAIAFRNPYEGGRDDRSLQQMIDEIHHFSDTVISAVR